MEHKLIHCNSLLKKITKRDTLFQGDYCIDPYQNCEFGCSYCDSSIEKTIYIKKNANEILRKELKKTRKGIIIIGSVHDPYQKAEEKYEITKELLKTIKEFQFPCHILTKSTLILRDLDLLSSISNCIVTFSLLSLKKSVVNIFEQDVPKPQERLQTIQQLNKKNIKTGIALIPILPYIIDSELEDIIKVAERNNANHFLYKHLELKGDQKELFRNILQKNYPELISKYDKLYKNNIQPDSKYIIEINEMIHNYCNRYKIAEKITL